MNLDAHTTGVAIIPLLAAYEHSRFIYRDDPKTDEDRKSIGIGDSPSELSSNIDGEGDRKFGTFEQRTFEQRWSNSAHRSSIDATDVLESSLTPVNSQTRGSNDDVKPTFTMYCSKTGHLINSSPFVSFPSSIWCFSLLISFQIIYISHFLYS